MAKENLITQTEEFNILKSRLSKMIEEDIPFEKNPFKPVFKYFIGIEFDIIFNENIFEAFRKFITKCELPHFVFYVLDPNPETYFYHHFRKFSVVKVGVDMSYNDFVNIMDSDPGGSPADALNVNSNELAIFSNANNWVVLGSREWEIAIVGFTDVDVKNTFEECFNQEDNYIISSIEDHVADLNKMLNFSKKTRAAYNQLIENYKV